MIAVHPNAPPTVQLTTPTSGASFIDPETIAISADADDSDGTIKSVKFFADGALLGTTTREPYSVKWHDAPIGTFHLTAVATDNRGASTTSAPVSITVKPNAPPHVQLTAPAPDSSFNDFTPIDVSADATDSDGTIRVVRFYAGTTRIGASRVAPYSITWRRAPVGTHVLTAVAIDDRGAKTRSAAVTIQVKPNEPPSVRLTAPTNHGTYPTSKPITVAADASDADGSIRRVDFYASAGGPAVLIGRRWEAPYSFLWKHVAIGTYSLTAVATDNHGLTTTSAAVDITVNDGSGVPDPTTAPLVQPANLVFEGAFRVPDGLHPGAHLDDWSIEHGWDSFQYGGLAMGVDPAHNSIFMVGNNQGALVAEIGVPSLVPSVDVAGLTVASLLQPFADPTEGLIDTINPGSDNSKKIGGLLPDPDHNRLFSAAYDYYDGNGSQQVSHFVSSLDMSLVGNVLGPYQVGTIGAGFVDGYFGLVPPEWQTAFGGPVINGNCCLGVISRTSYGPALFAIDPAMLGSSPLPAKPLVYYPRLHPLLEPGLTPCPDPNTCNPVVDGWNSQSTLFNGTTEVRGVAFPSGWRSVLFFGRHGVGEFCYGFGTDQVDLVGTIPDGEIDPYCMDPEDDSKGVHAYPYKDYVWAYDANDLAAAAAGARDPWTVRPYAVFPLTLPFATTGGTHMSATYDPPSGRIYVSQYQGDGVLPLIYVFKLQP